MSKSIYLIEKNLCPSMDNPSQINGPELIERIDSAFFACSNYNLEVELYVEVEINVSFSS